MARTQITNNSLASGAAEQNINDHGSLNLVVDLSTTGSIAAL